jgi:hypothetical protein
VREERKRGERREKKKMGREKRENGVCPFTIGELFSINFWLYLKKAPNLKANPKPLFFTYTVYGIVSHTF